MEFMTRVSIFSHFHTFYDLSIIPNYLNQLQFS